MTVNLYTMVISVHVVVAVLGVGLLGAIPIAARLARTAGAAPASKGRLFELLFRYTRWSLAAMAVP